MSEDLAIYDEIEIEDMTFDADLQLYTYPCPCGDRFQIGLEDLRDSEDIAVCPSCSLMIRVIFDLVRNMPAPPTAYREQRKESAAVEGSGIFESDKGPSFTDEPIFFLGGSARATWKRLRRASRHCCLDITRPSWAG